MKNVLIALLLAVSCFATPKKTTHVPTEAELCWKDVQAVSDLEFQLQTDESLQATFDRMYSCSETLKPDKLKSRIAFQLSMSAARALTINKQRKELESAKAAQATSEQSVQVLLKDYVDLQTEYRNYQAQSVQFAQAVNEYFASVPSQSAPAAQSKRGFFASFAQGAGEAMRNQAAKPTIHCESSTFGNQTSTDCR